MNDGETGFDYIVVNNKIRQCFALSQIYISYILFYYLFIYLKCILNNPDILLNICN